MAVNRYYYVRYYMIIKRFIPFIKNFTHPLSFLIPQVLGTSYKLL